MRRFGALGACVFCIMAACGSEEAEEKKGTPACGIDPWIECGAGETCWPVNQTGRLECKDAPTDQIQDQPCKLEVGSVDCSPHLYCLVTDQVAQTGICRFYCNQQSCPDGGNCVEVPVFETNKTVLVCVPDADAGIGGSGGGDASTGGTGGTSVDGSAGSAGSAGQSSGGSAGVSNGGTSGSAGSGA
jgi:hypothetical protein